MIILGDINTLDNQAESSIIEDGFEVFYASSFLHLKSIYNAYENVKVIIVDGDAENQMMEQNLKQKFSMKEDNTLLIFISEYRFSAFARAFQAGFDEFLAKPISKEALCALLKRTNHKTT